MRAARRMPTSMLAPIHTGGIGFCNGSTVQLASSSSKYEAFIVTKSSVHSRLTAVRHSSNRRPACFSVVPNARNSTSR